MARIAWERRGMTMGKPKWWQRLFPHYGNWGGPGWSGGQWCNDPEKTRWDVVGIDDMDEFFRFHDHAYQTGRKRNQADWDLFIKLWFLGSRWGKKPVTFYGKFYRVLALISFAVLPSARWLIKGNA